MSDRLKIALLLAPALGIVGLLFVGGLTNAVVQSLGVPAGARHAGPEPRGVRRGPLRP